MHRREFDNLADLRHRLFRLDLATIADAIRSDPGHLDAIERGQIQPSIDELDRLGAAYALPPERFVTLPIRLDANDAVPALALKAEDQRASAETRLRILAAADAARDLMSLQAMAGEDNRWRRFVREVKVLNRPTRSGLPPHKEGRHYARQLRRQLGLRGAIRSMRDLMDDAFPSIAVLYADLGSDQDLAGITFADIKRGPTIVLNRCGRNTRATVRRFSLAHELCHLLVDWNRMEPVAQLSEYREDARLHIEQRANAFAATLLCPQEVVTQLVGHHHPPAEIARRLVEDFGLHFGAARLTLRLIANARLGARPTRALDDRRWEDAESLDVLEGFPLPAVPPERRTAIARYGALLHSRGRLSTREFARVLRVDASAPLDDVVAYFGDAIRTMHAAQPTPAPRPEKQFEEADAYPGEFVIVRGEEVIGHAGDEATARRIFNAAARRVDPHRLSLVAPRPRPERAQPIFRARAFDTH